MNFVEQLIFVIREYLFHFNKMIISDANKEEISDLFGDYIYYLIH